MWVCGRHMCATGYMWRSEDSFWGGSPCLPLCFEVGSLISALMTPGWLAHKLPADCISASHLTIGVLGLQTCAAVSVFNMDSWDPNLGFWSKSLNPLGHPLPFGAFSTSCVCWVQDLTEHVIVLHETAGAHM